MKFQTVKMLLWQFFNTLEGLKGVLSWGKYILQHFFNGNVNSGSVNSGSVSSGLSLIFIEISTNWFIAIIPPSKYIM